MNRHDGYRNPRKQKPLGEVLFEARRNKDYSRAHLASITNIGVNSIVRYEKAGLEPEGQFPPAPKLAALCYHLNIPLSEAFWSCLSPEDFAEIEIGTVDELMDHPMNDFLRSQVDALVKDNHFLKEAFKCLLGLNRTFPFNETDAHWLVQELRKTVDRYEDFECRMLQWGAIQFSGIRHSIPNSEDKYGWVFNPQVAGSITDENQLPNVLFAWSARQQLKEAIENLDSVMPELGKLSREQAKAMHFKKKNSEDDLASPPSSESFET